MVVDIFTGDLFTEFRKGNFDVIAQGCNCHNMMGAGIAVYFAKFYPECFSADTQAYDYYTEKDSHKEMLGKISVALTKDGLVANLYTQFNGGRNADYFAMAESFKHLDDFLLEKIGKGYRLGLPFIGAGIGGLDINAVIALADSVLVNGDVYFIRHPNDVNNFTISKQFKAKTPTNPRYTYLLSDGLFFSVCKDGRVDELPSKLPFQHQKLKSLKCLGEGKLGGKVFTNKYERVLESALIIPAENWGGQQLNTQLGDNIPE